MNQSIFPLELVNHSLLKSSLDALTHPGPEARVPRIAGRVGSLKKRSKILGKVMNSKVRTAEFERT